MESRRGVQNKICTFKHVHHSWPPKAALLLTRTSFDQIRLISFMLPLKYRYFVVIMTALGLLVPFECPRGIFVLMPIGIIDNDRYELRLGSLIQWFYSQFVEFN